MTRDEFAKLYDVSRETMERLDTYVGLLKKWSQAINLLGPVDEAELWSRHIADCGQLIEHLPDDPKSWLDVGTGAGLPGIVIAILTNEMHPDLQMTLLDSDKKKAAFLREVCRQTSLRNVEVVAERTEDVPAKRYDVVSARAFAPLRRLLRNIALISPDAGQLLLHKGKNVDAEIDDALLEWNIQAQTLPSRTDPDGVILRIESFSRKP